MTAVGSVGPVQEAAPTLTVAVERAEAVDFAAVPTLRFRARVGAPAGLPVRAITLATQIHLAADRRRYDADETDRLRDLFGPPEGWDRALRGLLWTHATTQVPPFTGETVVYILVPCTYDFEVAAAKYLHALADGQVPLEFLFSGTVFYTVDGRLRAAHIPWDTRATHGMPVRVWRELMERHFPGSAWLRLDRDTVDRLRAYQARHALATWSETVERLLGDTGPTRSGG
ncbi:DUF6084 family protein [Plantactinospora endophytica]|uniref:Uncharacterized protein n=1 Tax=Plantactinospora endophytica TaxID=673535 RepID=A0ABQ4DZS0_9ACTN|nr:DUF6084 family protein [Plantactinospora endophytica]GIG87974.1 hypothetical protein Pen02_29100 [Plantactinospora endophytica]